MNFDVSVGKDIDMASEMRAGNNEFGSWTVLIGYGIDVVAGTVADIIDIAGALRIHQRGGCLRDFRQFD